MTAMPHWLYPIGTILIRNKEMWCKHLANLFKVKPQEVPLHLQTLRQAGRPLRFISKGNLRYLLWRYLRTRHANPPGCPEPFADAPVTRHRGTMQFQVNASEECLIILCAELDLFGYMYTAVDPPRTRKSVVGLTKMVKIGGDERNGTDCWKAGGGGGGSAAGNKEGTDCWKVSFTIDVARLGRLTDHDPSGQGRDELLLKDKDQDQNQDQEFKEWKRRLQKVLEAIHKVLIEPCYLAVVGLAQVPVPIFDPFLNNACAGEPAKIKTALKEALQNGWLPPQKTGSEKNSKQVWVILSPDIVSEMVREVTDSEHPQEQVKEDLQNELGKIRKDFGIIFAGNSTWYEQIANLLHQKLREHEQATTSQSAGNE